MHCIHVWLGLRAVSTHRHWQQAPRWPRPGIGHNGGPPLEDEPPGKLLFVLYRWKKAHAEAWRAPSGDIALFRVRRAEAAGVTYREYMLTLLDAGRHLQRADVEARHKKKGPQSP